MKQTLNSYGYFKECWIQDQAILLMNVTHMRSEILTTTYINIIVNWGFYREYGGSRVVLNVLFFVIPVVDYLGALCQMVKSHAAFNVAW
jgi:hypothetical protein